MCVRSDGDLTDYSGQTSPVLFVKNYLEQSTAEFPVDQNFLTCPINVLLLLCSLLGSGATKGLTAVEVGRAIHIRRELREHNLKPAMEEAVALHRDLYHELTGEQTILNDRPTKVIKIANGFFLKAGYEVHSYFNWSLRNEFSSVYEQVNFQDNAAAARKLNAWVNSETNGLIPQLFKRPEELSPETRIALISVLTFKDTWRRPFTPQKTRTEGFFMNNGRRIDVPMMSSTEELPYLYDSSLGIQMVRKHFTNARYSFVAVMPTDREETSGMEKVLNGAYRLEPLVKKQEEKMVSLKLPKFKLELSFSLIKTLQSMEINKLFQKGHADMTGVTNSERLYVNLLKQSNILQVDESGVEAASAVVAVAVPMSFVPPEVSFHANSTFACFIYDEQLSLPIFAGRVNRPM